MSFDFFRYFSSSQKHLMLIAMDYSNLENLLYEGFPITKDQIIKWNSRLNETILIGYPIVKKWKRWADTSTGMMQVQYVSAQWKNIKVPGLDSISVVSVAYQTPQETDIFKLIECYSSDYAITRKELAKLFGTPSQELVSYLDRGITPVEFFNDIWFLAQQKVKIHLSPSGPLIFIYND